MKKNTFPNKKLEGGQSLVELALSLTIILLLLSGAVTFGMAYFSFLAINDAAQEGALYGSFNPQDVSGIKNRVQAASTSPVDLSQIPDSQIAVTYANGLGSDCQGTVSGKANTITVTVTYNYQVFMPFISAVIGSNTIPLTGSATDPVLVPLCP